MTETNQDLALGNGRLTIDLAALSSNWKKLKNIAKGAETSAVVKADAYGLGIGPVVEALSKAGCETFFVATVEEGARARKANKTARIYVLNGFYASHWPTYKKHKLTPILCCAKSIDDFLALTGRKNEAAIHIDTGMNRLGLSASELANLVEDEEKMSAFKPIMVMSHFACADEPEHRMNKKQLAAFSIASLKFPEAKRSMANSAGIMLNSNTHFNIVRPGIALYGGEAVNNVENPMKPVVKLESRILQIRHVKKGECVGYGAAEKLKRDSILATCGTGYADGYHRGTSSAGVAVRKLKGTYGAGGMIGPHHVPLVGRVSMDLCVFDVTNVPQRVLDKAEWIEMLNKTIRVDDIAHSAGTVGYEILTSLGNRFDRIYVGG